MNLTTMYKIVIESALCAAAFAAGPPAHGAPAPYHPAPNKEEKISPQLFGYEYGVANDYSNGKVKVAGSFKIVPLKSPITTITRALTTATTRRSNISIQV